MELIMKLVTRLVEALEKSAACSGVAVELARQSLAVNQEILAFHKAQTAGIELIQGTVGTLESVAAGQGAVAEQVAQASTEAKPNPPDMQAAMDKVEERRAETAEQVAKTQRLLDAAEAAQKAEQAAKAAAKDAAKDAEQKSKKISVDEVRAALKRYAAVNGNEVAMAMLSKHGAVSVSAMEPEKYEAVMKDLA